MGMKNRGVNGLEVPRFKIDILRACDTLPQQRSQTSALSTFSIRHCGMLL